MSSPNIIGVGEFIHYTLLFVTPVTRYSFVTPFLANNESTKLSSVYSFMINISLGSSSVGQDSLSHHGDHEIGVYVIDRSVFHNISRSQTNLPISNLFNSPDFF